MMPTKHTPTSSSHYYSGLVDGRGRGLPPTPTPWGAMEPLLLLLGVEILRRRRRGPPTTPGGKHVHWWRGRRLSEDGRLVGLVWRQWARGVLLTRLLLLLLLLLLRLLLE